MTALRPPPSPPGPASADSAVADAIAEAERLFALQRAHRWAMARTTAAERAARLRRLRAALIRHRAGLVAAMHADFRKPAAEVELTEMRPLLGEIDHAVRHLARWMRPERVGTPLLLAGTRSEVRPVPKGVVLVMAPWNYPALLLLGPLVAAVAAGNCVILRPSEKTPHTSDVLGRVVREAFDEREVALVVGDVPLAQRLLELPFDHFFFTGSTRVGRLVMAAAARHLAGVTLELGGKSPAVVDAGTDLRLAARRIVWGKCLNGGQTCVAPDYVLADERVRAPLLDEMRAVVEEYYGASPEARRASPDFCRLIDDGAFARLTGALDASLAAGARLVTGGERDAGERYLAPTIVTGLDWDAPLMREELFGPVLPVLGVRDLAEAAERIRARPAPLALYVFARDRAAAERLLAGTTSGGAVLDNTVLHLGNPDLPFGGIGESGVGSYHGRHGFRAFSHERAVLVQGRWGIVPLLHPPYRTRVRRLLGVARRLFG